MMIAVRLVSSWYRTIVISDFSLESSTSSYRYRYSNHFKSIRVQDATSQRQRNAQYLITKVFWLRIVKSSELPVYHLLEKHIEQKPIL